MSPLVPGLGVELAYEERGAGRAVLLIHGIASTREDWGPVARALAGDARVIVYDRRGYGESEAPEPYERTTVSEQAEDAARLLAALKATPAVVCGRDLGALVCLDLLCRHPEKVRAAVLVNPALYQVSAQATEALSAERLALEQALRDGGPERAVVEWLGAQGAPPERIERARTAHAAFFADFAALPTLPVSRGELRELGAPVAVLATASAAAHVRATAEVVAGLAGVRLRDAGELVDAVRELL